MTRCPTCRRGRQVHDACVTAALSWLVTGRFAADVQDDVVRTLCSTCYLCGVMPAQHVEHVHPRALGGANTWDSVAGACARCNLAKSTRSASSVGAAGWADRLAVFQQRAHASFDSAGQTLIQWLSETSARVRRDDWADDDDVRQRCADDLLMIADDHQSEVDDHFIVIMPLTCTYTRSRRSTLQSSDLRFLRSTIT